jgi:hypothetical protein
VTTFDQKEAAGAAAPCRHEENMMRKIVYAIVAGSLLVSGSAYAAGTTTPAKDQTTKQVKVKPMKVKHASKHTKKNAKPAPAEPKNG